ncbi:hypothetical protein LTR37_002523 [Vermiconidia calcicola]|uniref:Uncharacterized protein n=1 Tax=Vermiconidia calcicola TaxID=1690605 RepID=A0ACC3NSZ8_9PEZI|nr:hypothetical protein LTR37_002523 [Vermiconidia calcicola]
MSEKIKSDDGHQDEDRNSVHEQFAHSLKDAKMEEKDPSTNEISPEELENGFSSPTISETQRSDHERDVVFWDGPADPANPLNWSTTKKGVNLGVLSAMTFLTPLASSFFAPGIPELMREFDSDRTAATLDINPELLLNEQIAPSLPLSLSPFTFWDGH